MGRGRSRNGGPPPTHRAPLDSLVYFIASGKQKSGGGSKQKPGRRKSFGLKLSDLPNDMIYTVLGFLGSRGSAVASCVCREFYYTGGETAVAAFFELYGGLQPASFRSAVVALLRAWSLPRLAAPSTQPGLVARP